ncbi:YqhV family protein [Ureibacillus sp. MALMAid1270]|uniref:YqhV family protein n=1 Tax=Ureibacillus sp. MALMAid1270 TaxID=3411629 RepID=UPI003BA584AB
MLESALLYMVLLRIFSGSVDIAAAGLMFKFNDLEKALVINTMLALVGPTVMIITTGIGVSGLGDKISLGKIIFLLSGVALILISMRMK